MAVMERGQAAPVAAAGCPARESYSWTFQSDLQGPKLPALMGSLTGVLDWFRVQPA